MRKRLQNKLLKLAMAEGWIPTKKWERIRRAEIRLFRGQTWTRRQRRILQFSRPDDPTHFEPRPT
jgi:hypothetical protein